MRNAQGFDIWASGYDASVLESDAKNEYPFAGYKVLMNTIFDRVTAKINAMILDVGIGTGFLPSKLSEVGCEVWGIDFSDEMLRIAGERVPGAKLFRADFSQPLPSEVSNERFDFIISTYALHHLTDTQKIDFIKSTLPLLSENGELIIGDVSFQSRVDYGKCKLVAGNEFDDEEYYWIADEILTQILGARYMQVSHCAGVYTFTTDGK